MHQARLALPILIATLVAACGAPSVGVPVPATPPERPTSQAMPSVQPVTPMPVAGRSDFGGPTPYTAPSSTPTPEPRLRADFEAVPLGSQPDDWVDVATEKTVPAWVYAGNWRVVEAEGGNRAFLHDDVRVQPAVSFQRYRGTALGTKDGLLPAKYWTELDMKPIRSPHNYPPTGDQGVQLYYADYNRYVEIVLKPDQIEVWEADNAEPRTTKGWKRLWNRQTTNPVGTARRVGALVDTVAGTFETWIDGEKMSTVKSAVIKPQPAWLALRGIGNVVSFDNVVIEPRP